MSWSCRADKTQDKSLGRQRRMAYLCQAVDAVEHTLRDLPHDQKGMAMRQVFQMLYGEQTHTIYGAALRLYLSDRTVRRYNRLLLLQVGLHMG